MNHHGKTAAVCKTNASFLFVCWVGYEVLFYLKKIVHIFMLSIFRYLHTVLTKKAILKKFLKNILMLRQAPRPILGQTE